MLTNCIWFLFQFGNTCYCNSVLQALYFCRPFRDRVLQFKQLQKNNKKESLLTCLADLFYSIASQKKKVGTIAPKKFITRLRKEYGKCHCIFITVGNNHSWIWNSQGIWNNKKSGFFLQISLTTSCNKMPTSSWTICWIVCLNFFRVSPFNFSILGP